MELTTLPNETRAAGEGQEPMATEQGERLDMGGDQSLLWCNPAEHPQGLKVPPYGTRTSQFTVDIQVNP